jgi:hypothetical protein
LGGKRPASNDSRRPVAFSHEGRQSTQSVKKRFVKNEVRAPTLNLKFIGTSADVDFAQMRDF